MQSEQYSSFLALSSSVSELDVPLEAEGPEAGCSELELPVLQPLLVPPQPGEVEAGGTRGGVGVDSMGQTGGRGESRGGVVGSLRGGSNGPFICVKLWVSSGLLVCSQSGVLLWAPGGDGEEVGGTVGGLSPS